MKVISDERDKAARKPKGPVLAQSWFIVSSIHETMGRTKPRNHLDMRKHKCDERLTILRIVRLAMLGLECLVFVHGTRIATPNG